MTTVLEAPQTPDVIPEIESTDLQRVNRILEESKKLFSLKALSVTLIVPGMTLHSQQACENRIRDVQEDQREEVLSDLEKALNIRI